MSGRAISVNGLNGDLSMLCIGSLMTSTVERQGKQDANTCPNERAQDSGEGSTEEIEDSIASLQVGDQATLVVRRSSSPDAPCSAGRVVRDSRNEAHWRSAGPASGHAARRPRSTSRHGFRERGGGRPTYLGRWPRADGGRAGPFHPPRMYGWRNEFATADWEFRPVWSHRMDHAYRVCIRYNAWLQDQLRQERILHQTTLNKLRQVTAAAKETAERVPTTADNKGSNDMDKCDGREGPTFGEGRPAQFRRDRVFRKSKVTP
jgi:hypothetical protein